MKKLSMLFLLLAVIFSLQVFSNPLADSEQDGHIFLHTGSPLILKDERIKTIDPSNPDLAATVIDGRTLLPLRAISEHFGAKVSYDDQNRTAIIEYKNAKYLFPIDQKSYRIESAGKVKEIEIDTNSTIIQERTMVPLRVLAEDILKKDVSYFDRVIAIGSGAIDLEAQNDLLQQIKSKIGLALKARNIDEVLKSVSGTSYLYHFKDQMTIVEGEFGPVPGMVNVSDLGSPESSESLESDFSQTNIQIEGIDEADLVKTDGKNIYLVAEKAIRIVNVQDGNLEELAIIPLAKDKSAQEIFIDGDRLIVLGTRYEQIEADFDSTRQKDSLDMMIMPPFYNSKHYSFIDVFDISTPDAPYLIKSHEIEGHYSTSRKNGNIVYLVANSNFFREIFLPEVRDSATGFKFEPVELNDIMITPGYPAEGFISISALDIRNDAKAEVELISAYGAITYMNDHALYIASSNYGEKTTITKFAISGLNVGYAGSGEVDGYLTNQFALDEYAGHLRVATTQWEKGNNLYVLDSSLNITGAVTDLAKGESIYSVRFLGSKGYIVTFRTIDPLFVFDLSDPKDPKVTGELEIPGFSSYLHPISETHLLGLGMDVVDIYQKDKWGKEVVVGQRHGGIKVSLFDVSDMGKPEEVANLIIGESGSYTDALGNHKALMFDKNKKLMAFDAYLTDDPYDYQLESGAVLISYENDNITLKKIIYSEQPDFYSQDLPSASRIIYIDDLLYYIQGSKITAYQYDDLSKTSTLVLQPNN